MEAVFAPRATAHLGRGRGRGEAGLGRGASGQPRGVDQHANDKEDSAESRVPAEAPELADEPESAEVASLLRLQCRRRRTRCERVFEGAARARPEEYSYLEDVPHSLKRKARTLAAVCDPVVMKYFETRGEFDGSHWACGEAEEALVRR